MAQRTTVTCPLGDQCPSGGKHYPDSSIYREHQRLSNGGGHGEESSGSKEDYRERVYHPMADQSDDPETAYLNRVDLRNRPVTEWVDHLRNRSNSGEAIKGSTIVGYSADYDNDSFTVSYKTGEQLVYSKDPENDDCFVATKYKGTIDENNIVNQSVVPADEVEEHIDKEDKGNRLQAAALAGASAAPLIWSSMGGNDGPEPEPDYNRNILGRLLNKFFDSASRIFKV